MPTRRTYTAALEAEAVLEVLSGIKSQAELAREHRLEPDLIELETAVSGERCQRVRSTVPTTLL